jgi:maltooligosyltrehalose trehalohydrolase
LYSYLLDGTATFPDPASRSQPQGVHGPSAIADPSFSWSDADWKGIALGDMIIYELHVGTFTEQGDLEGVISKLDYLRALGVNTIELMPVTQFPGKRNWGYDGVYPFAVHHDYGGVKGLKKLVNEAHRHGIAVILDVVYNHLGPEGNCFREYGPYFTGRYKTFWGEAINFDDAGCDGVRHFFWQNALMWLDEFHVDGLRLDAVHAIWDFGASHFVEELAGKVAALEEDNERQKVLIAELDLNAPRYINPTFKGGYGLDGQWIDEFHHALHSLVTGETNGYYEDFGEPIHLARSLRDSYVYTGQYSTHRKRCFGVVPKDNPYSQFVVFGQNHDQVGNRMLGDRLSASISFEALKLVAAAVLLSPHVPLLFMGEEYGEKKPFQYFISHTDEELVANVRKGRREEFGHFNWEGEVPDPQAEETFRQCKLSWNDKSDPLAATLLSFYKYLIAFRYERFAMKGKERNAVHVYDPVGKVIAFERRCGPDTLVIIMNFDKVKASVTLPVSRTGKKIFDSSAMEWKGPGEVAGAQIAGDQSVMMNAESVVVFEC